MVHVESNDVLNILDLASLPGGTNSLKIEFETGDKIDWLKN